MRRSRAAWLATVSKCQKSMLTGPAVLSFVPSPSSSPPPPQALRARARVAIHRNVHSLLITAPLGTDRRSECAVMSMAVGVNGAERPAAGALLPHPLVVVLEFLTGAIGGGGRGP